MSTTYTQRKTTTQKKVAPSASSVLDASSQSEALQRKADMANNAVQREEAPRPNNTGMPDNLKSGIESLSGFSMDDVRVHYNSSKPATVQALAYTQGTDIHVAPGQEKHLPHEAWHVAQQMAGRVSPTTNVNGMPANDNATLEHEADVMGEKAVQCKKGKEKSKKRKISKNIAQFLLGTFDKNKLNVVGENHDESDKRRDKEKEWTKKQYDDKGGHYWLEYEFNFNKRFGDPQDLRVKFLYTSIRDNLYTLLDFITKVTNKIYNTDEEKNYYIQEYDKYIETANYYISLMSDELTMKNIVFDICLDARILLCCDALKEKLNIIKTAINWETINKQNVQKWIKESLIITNDLDDKLRCKDTDSDTLCKDRSVAMHSTATLACQHNKKGIWKIGDKHVWDIYHYCRENHITNREYQLIDQDAFNKLIDNRKEDKELKKGNQ